MEEDQIILVDKPAGISSFGVVARVRRELRDQFGHKVKLGHTGTLDPPVFSFSSLGKWPKNPMNF